LLRVFVCSLRLILIAEFEFWSIFKSTYLLVYCSFTLNSYFLSKTELFLYFGENGDFFIIPASGWSSRFLLLVLLLSFFDLFDTIDDARFLYYGFREAAFFLGLLMLTCFDFTVPFSSWAYKSSSRGVAEGETLALGLIVDIHNRLLRALNTLVKSLSTSILTLLLWLRTAFKLAEFNSFLDKFNFYLFSRI